MPPYFLPPLVFHLGLRATVYRPVCGLRPQGDSIAIDVDGTESEPMDVDIPSAASEQEPRPAASRLPLHSVFDPMSFLCLSYVLSLYFLYFYVLLVFPMSAVYEYGA